MIDAIVAEWARLTGIQQTEVEKSETSASSPASCDMYARARMTSDAVNSTHMRVTSDDLAERAGVRAGVSLATPECLPPSQARAGANDFDPRHAKPAPPPATTAPEVLTASPRANESGLCHAIHAHAHANRSGSLPTGVN